MTLTKTLSKRRKEGEMVKRKSSISKIQISAPVELISTTNMISYTAPTLYNSPLSATTVSTSGRFFPLAASPSNSHSSSPSSSDVESSSPPTSPTTPSPNHLSMYFALPPSPPPMSPARSLSTRSTTSNRMPQRSMSTNSIPSGQQRRSQGPPPRALHRSMRRSNNPFGAELAKVSEIAEEFGIKGICDMDEEIMYSHGLQKFCADDYLQEIGNHAGVFGDELPLLQPGWI